MHFSLNYLSLGGFVIAVSSILNSFLTFLYNRNSSKKLSFKWILFNLAVSLWGIGLYFLFSSLTRDNALFWGRFLNLSAIFIPVLFFNFVCCLLKIFETKKKEIHFYYFVAFAILALSLIFPEYFIPDVEIMFANLYYPSSGIIYYIYTLFFTYTFVYSLFLLFRAMNSNKYISQEKNQIRYLLLGCAIGFAGGSTAFFPVFNIKIAPLGIYLTPIYIFTVSYAIIKYNLMDINLAWKYFAKYIGYVAMNGIVFTATFFFLQKCTNYPCIYFSIFSCFYIFFTRDWLLTKIESFFLRKQKNIWTELDNISKNNIQSYDLKDIIKIVVNQVADALNLTHSSCYMLSDAGDFYKLFLTNNETSSVQTLDLENLVVKHLKETKKKLYKEDIISLKQDSEFIEILNQLEYEVYFPIFFNGEMICVVCYGKKLDNSLYHKQDLKYLDDIIKKTQFEIINVKMLETMSQKYAEKFIKFFKNKYTNNMMDSIQNLGRARTLAEFCGATDKLLFNSIKAKAITIYLYNEETEQYEYQESKVLTDEKERRHSKKDVNYPNLGPIYKTIKENSAIVSYLKEMKEVLRTEEIAGWAEKTRSKDLVGTAKLLSEMQGKLVGALFHSTFLGFIVVGEKEDGQEYTGEEIKLLGLLLRVAPLIINSITLRDKALKDSLMGIYNKGFLMRRLSEEIVFATTSGEAISVLMIDIDFFKKFNTDLGHLKADEVLKAMGAFLKKFVRENDEVFRYGGEEIVIILPNTKANDARYLAERINLKVKEDPIFLDFKNRHRRGVTISIGVATLKDSASSEERSNREIKNLRDKLIEAADDQLYAAKNAGRDQVKSDKEFTIQDLLVRQKIKEQNIDDKEPEN